MLCYDLHSHSTASDGELTPAELVHRASARGVDVLGLTDHDVLDGLAEAVLTASRLGLILVPGVEISVSWQGRLVHIVGLGLDAGNQPLQQGLMGLRAKRRIRAAEIARRLEHLGIPGAAEGARQESRGSVVSRSHFARFLVKRGFAKDFKTAFKRYLGHGKAAFVPCEWAGLEEAVAWIRGAGGQAVVAHPARYQMSRRLLQAFLAEFRQLGGCGMEVASSSHSHQETAAMAAHARQFGLLASVGSDFHSPMGSWAELGKFPALPEHCVPIWKNWQLAPCKVPA